MGPCASQRRFGDSKAVCYRRVRSFSHGASLSGLGQQYRAFVHLWLPRREACGRSNVGLIQLREQAPGTFHHGPEPLSRALAGLRLASQRDLNADGQLAG